MQYTLQREICKKSSQIVLWVRLGLGQVRFWVKLELGFGQVRFRLGFGQVWGRFGLGQPLIYQQRLKEFLIQGETIPSIGCRICWQLELHRYLHQPLQFVPIIILQCRFSLLSFCFFHAQKVLIQSKMWTYRRKGYQNVRNQKFK